LFSLFYKSLVSAAGSYTKEEPIFACDGWLQDPYQILLAATLVSKAAS